MSTSVLRTERVTFLQLQRLLSQLMTRRTWPVGIVATWQWSWLCKSGLIGKWIGVSKKTWCFLADVVSIVYHKKKLCWFLELGCSGIGLKPLQTRAKDWQTIQWPWQIKWNIVTLCHEVMRSVPENKKCHYYVIHVSSELYAWFALVYAWERLDYIGHIKSSNHNVSIHI